MHSIEIDFADPVEAAEALGPLPFLTFLDSAMVDPLLGRYSFVAADPFARLEGRQPDAGWVERLKALLARFAAPPQPGLPPFQGGAAGLFCYDLGRSLERLAPAAIDDLVFPDLSLGVYDVVVAFDLVQRRAWILSTGLPETEPAARRARAVERAAQFATLIAEGSAPRRAGPIEISGWASNFSRPTYVRAVAEVIERILAGDIFQANLSQRFAAPVPADFDAFGFYKRLRAVNPAPFAAYLDHGGFQIASASPERFLRVDAGLVETRPIKGTRPRFADPLVDMLQTKALAESRKDRAENVMIVDLLRNDLSKVCAPGSVLAPQLCAVESYATVHHLVSTVTGRLADGFGPVDLIAASFPGGSITGAPKLRAMEIIAELEGHARGPYCGAIGYVGFNGMMDLNIVIRTASFRRGVCVVQAGGGIVTASDPGCEYVETLDKARRIFEAFGAREFA